ncbi:MAG: sigma-70 family RNA polymerase sigma factor [Anaerolineales bacterium]|nr:sigma-70 family RNA polymerase sigma factor [Anaerolineales bacterium]
MIDIVDHDTVERARRGDSQALGRLYDENHAALYRYLWARLQDRKLAEDLTGDVFLRMLEALPRYRPSDVPFRAWLYRIARNLLVDHYRKAGIRQAVPLQETSAGLPTAGAPEPLVERILTVERMHQALACLDGALQEVVSLRFLAGLSLRETAATLGKTQAAVKALQHRGLAALRLAFSEGLMNDE